MKVFISGGGNNPSGGHKVLNQTVMLFIEKGFEAYCVVPEKDCGKAKFLNDAAPVLYYKEVLGMCTENDVIIDLWPLRCIYESTCKCMAKHKIFWQHGVSLPSGPDFVGEKVFSKDSCYNQYWNVSEICANYFSKKYGVSSTIVHPFFNSETMKTYSAKRTKKKREGILLLSRRGRLINDLIIEKFGKENKVTVLAGAYHEEDFFNLLLEHKVFVCSDAGIGEQPNNRKSIVISFIKLLKNKIRLNKSNSWIIPKEKWLGFPMPPVEAALCGCAVVAFAMGGGLEWMTEENCFLAEDKNWDDLISKLNDALICNGDELSKKNTLAYSACHKFTKLNTWAQITRQLPELTKIKNEHE